MSNNQKKPFYKNIKFWIIVAIIFFVINMILSVVFYDRYSNVFTAFSGWVSGISTIVLGALAFWQNKRYKALADDYNDKLLMPELYISSSTMDKLKNSSYFDLVKGENIKEIETVRCEVIPIFFLRGPIINLKVNSISQESEFETYCNIEGKTYRDEDSPFGLLLYIPKSFINNESIITAVVMYENIYGTKYEKNISFYIDNDNDEIKINNIIMNPARRIK